MDMLVSVCRVLASRPRLRLLRVIHAQPGTTVQALATALALPIESVSQHLKVLTGFRFVESRPQGRYMHYRPVPTRVIKQPFLRDLQLWLQTFFGPPRLHCTLAQVCNGAMAPDRRAEETLLVQWFTSYTHLRRLLLLRYLLRHEHCSTEQLAGAVRMSNTAVCRHMCKLRRRGLVAAADGPPLRWRLERSSADDCRQQLKDIVLRALHATVPSDEK